MRNLILFLFFGICILSVNQISGQCNVGDLRIDSQSDLDNFLILYGNCNEIIGTVTIGNNNELTDLSDLSNIEIVTGSLFIANNDSINSLLGLENLHTVTEKLTLQNLGALTSIVPLQNLEEAAELSINNVPISNFNGLQRLKKLDRLSLTSLALENFMGIDSLKSLTLLTLFNTDAVSFVGTEKIDSITNITINGFLGKKIDAFHSLKFNNTFGLIDCAELEELNVLSNFTSLNYIGLGRSPKLHSLPGFQNLVHLNTSFFFDLNSLENLSFLKNLKSIADLTMRGGTNLISLGLDSLQLITQRVRLLNNPKLDFCSEPYICEFLKNGGNYTINSNGSNCSSLIEILEGCGNESIVQIEFFNDKNQNTIKDPNESWVNNLRPKITPSQFNPRYLFNSTYQTYFLPNGEYEITFDNQNREWESLGINTFQINIDQNYQTDTIQFAVTAIENQSLVKPVLQFDNPICGEFFQTKISARNDGSFPASGILWLEYNDKINDISLAADTLKGENSYGWRFNDLEPSQTFFTDFRLQAVDSNFIGDTIQIFSYIEFIDVIGTHTSDTFLINQPLACTSQSNNKTVFPQRPDQNYTFFNEELFYTIHFQNPSDSTNLNVTIYDTLDNSLDILTFKLLESSHARNLQLDILDRNILVFEFNNILLSDPNINYDNSNGFVTYSIKTKMGIGENTIIQNKATVVYDSNSVETNSTSNTFVSELNVGFENLQSLDIQIYPNPSSGKIYFSGSDMNNNTDITILDLSGKRLFNSQLNARNSLDLSHLNSGLYLIQIKQENGFIFSKIYLEKN